MIQALPDLAPDLARWEAEGGALGSPAPEACIRKASPTRDVTTQSGRGGRRASRGHRTKRLPEPTKD